MKQIPQLDSFKHICRCEFCNCVFGTNGLNSKFCPACLPEVHSLRVMRSRKKKDSSVLIGVGSGGAQLGDRNIMYDASSENHDYFVKKGYSSTLHFKQIARKLWGSRCVACGSYDKINVHHVSGDKSDNSASNIIPLCERCHVKVHYTKRMTEDALLESLKRIVGDAVFNRLAELKLLEDENGALPERVLNYVGALYIVKNGITARSVSDSRSNRKQEDLIKGLTACACACANCGTPSTSVNSRLVLVYLRDNKIVFSGKKDAAVTMLCKTCYNAIVASGDDITEYIGDAEEKSRNEAGSPKG